MKRKIGKTGTEVFAIGLGGMPLSIQGRPPEEQGIAVIRAALDAGIDFIDTANVYCQDQRDIGHNERLITAALKQIGVKSPVVVATKGGLARPNGEWVTDGAPLRLRQACEQSLRDLQTETIFLYQLHAPDDRVPFEDSVLELKKLKEEGKILHIGLSNVSREELERALKITRIETVQNRCNVYSQNDIQNGLIEFCSKNEITYIPYSPVGGGDGHHSIARDPILVELARKYQTSPYCIALNWLLSLGNHVIPIPGASKPSSVRDSARAPFFTMEDADLKRIRKLR